MNLGATPQGPTKQALRGYLEVSEAFQRRAATSHDPYGYLTQGQTYDMMISWGKALLMK